MILPLLVAQVQEAAPPDRWRSEALGKFFSLQFSELSAREWEFVAYNMGLRAIFVLILITVAWTVSSWLATAVRLALGRVKFDETLTIFFSRLVRWLILLLVALTCLSYFGIQTTGFAALIGAAGLAIGLAFQGTLSNFAAGAMLLIFRPYKVGDEVNVAGYAGTVREIELFTTALDTPDNRRIIVPNSSIFGAVIENITHHPVRRFTVAVGTAYSADIDATRTALELAVRNVALLATTPAASVVLNDLGASSVNWVINAWAKRENFGDAKQQLIRSVKLELDRAKIGIPFPQLDIHLDPPPEAGAA
jgi:small conductance mechanosensitive channel